MSLRFLDWIWHVRGTLELSPGQSSDGVFDRLDPLFRQVGTSHQRTNDTLIFQKKDQAAQDKMSVFDGGTLQVEQELGRPVLRYDLTSRALLFCFLAPFLFLAFSQLVVALNKSEKPSTEASSKSGTTSEKKPVAEKAPMPLNPIDKLLGAPEPEKSKKGDPSAASNQKPSPTAAYIFAALFAILYIAGRVLEDRLVKKLFRKRLEKS